VGGDRTVANDCIPAAPAQVVRDQASQGPLALTDAPATQRPLRSCPPNEGARDRRPQGVEAAPAHPERTRRRVEIAARGDPRHHRAIRRRQAFDCQVPVALGHRLLPEAWKIREIGERRVRVASSPLYVDTSSW